MSTHPVPSAEAIAQFAKKNNWKKLLWRVRFGRLRMANVPAVMAWYEMIGKLSAMDEHLGLTEPSPLSLQISMLVTKDASSLKLTELQIGEKVYGGSNHIKRWLAGEEKEP